MSTASSASLENGAPRSAAETTATVPTPSLFAVRIIRTAISPRLAIRILLNIGIPCPIAQGSTGKRVMTSGSAAEQSRCAGAGGPPHHGRGPREWRPDQRGALYRGLVSRDAVQGLQFWARRRRAFGWERAFSWWHSSPTFCSHSTYCRARLSHGSMPAPARALRRPRRGAHAGKALLRHARVTYDLQDASAQDVVF